MEAMLFHVTDSSGNQLCEPMMIPFVDLYWIKQTFVCELQFGQIILL